MKQCTKCGDVKPLDEFGPRSSGRDGRRAACRECCREASREYAQRRYAANPEAGRERLRQRYAANPEAARAASRRWYAANTAEAREASRRYRQANPGKVRESGQRVHDRLREAVFGHYGRSCTCCGSAEALSIDHMGGGGTRHRTAIATTSGIAMYYWLVRNGFPPGFQTLCMPCNRSKGDGERCRINHALASAGPAEPGS